MTFKRDPVATAKRAALVEAVKVMGKGWGAAKAVAAAHGVTYDVVNRIDRKLRGKTYGSENLIKTEEIVRLCFCGGCRDAAVEGKNFCERHSVRAMPPRVVAGMSEATRRKLTGARA